MSYSRAREILRDKLSAIGLNPNVYGLHSFRSGEATAVANSGVSDSVKKAWAVEDCWRLGSLRERYG